MTAGAAAARVAVVDLLEPDRLRVAAEPALIYAKTRVELLAGFRELRRTAALLRLLPDRWAHGLADHLAGPLADPLAESDGDVAAHDRTPEDEAALLAGVVDDLRSLEGRALRRILPDLGDAARHAGARAVREELRHRSQRRGDPSLNPEAARLFSAVGRVAARSRRSPDALIALLLHGVALAPGEAVLMPTGLVHLPGTGRTLQVRAPADADPAGLPAPVLDTPPGLSLVAELGVAPGPAPRLDPAVRTGDLLRYAPRDLAVELTIGLAEQVLDPSLATSPGGRQATVVDLDDGPEPAPGAPARPATDARPRRVAVVAPR